MRGDVAVKQVVELWWEVREEAEGALSLSLTRSVLCASV